MQKQLLTPGLLQYLGQSARVVGAALS